jgi:thiol-disulfide isomerase/thioredoxin
VVLNFWATWCGPCQYEIPHLVELRKGFDPMQVAIIGISLDQGEKERILPLLDRFVVRYEINYPIVLDNKSELLQQFYKKDLATVVVPMTYIFDQQGQIYRTHYGVPRGTSSRSDPGTVLGEEIQALLDRT